MPRKRSWEDDDLVKAVKESKSVRMVLQALSLVPAGGNYQQVQRAIKRLELDTSHFTGQGWRQGRVFEFVPKKELVDILVENSDFQSYKLRNRLFKAGLKSPICELCGWAEQAEDGRIPVELDHVNGDHHDNRLDNLRILCPNCHSLQSTHRGKNQKRRK
jgi:hypothetical protein